MGKMNAAPVIFLMAMVGLTIVLGLDKKKKFFKSIRVFIKGVKLSGNGFDVRLNIQNPNSVPLEIRSVVGDFFLNGSKVGNISEFGFHSMRANSESSIDIHVKPKILNIFTSMTQVVNSKGGVLLRFAGVMNIDNKPVEMDIKYSL